MDNNTFETEMINTVNANAKAKREATKRKKTNKARAVAELLCWVLSFVAITYSVYVLCCLDIVSAGLAIAITSCFGYVAGFRASGLIKLI